MIETHIRFQPFNTSVTTLVMIFLSSSFKRYQWVTFQTEKKEKW